MAMVVLCMGGTRLSIWVISDLVKIHYKATIGTTSSRENMFRHEIIDLSQLSGVTVLGNHILSVKSFVELHSHGGRNGGWRWKRGPQIDL